MSTASVETWAPRSTLIWTLSEIDGDVPAEHLEDLLTQHRDEVDVAAELAFVFQQDLQPLARHRRGAGRPEEVEQLHAALRPNSLLKNPFLSAEGMVSSISSPHSRRAASV